jgi:hypothetical protein
MRSLRNLRQAVESQCQSTRSVVNKHTLEALGQHLGGRALGRHRRIEDAILAVVAAFLVVNGHATDAAGMHALPAPAALQAGAPLDGPLLLERATARRRRALVEGCGAPRCARRRALGKLAIEDGAATRGRIEVLLEPAPALVGRAGAVLVVCEVVYTHI